MPKLRAGSSLVEVEIKKKQSRLWLKFPFNRILLEEVKLMEGAKWHGFDKPIPTKEWSIADSERNHFQLQYLEHSGKSDPLNPYFRFDMPLLDVKSTRPLRSYQDIGFRHIVTRRHCILAHEMGLGKTLVGIEAIEYAGFTDVWWIAPKSALYSSYLEFEKWKAKIIPKFFTYEGFKSFLSDYKGPAPRFVVFDECSRLKNPTAQRTQAAKHLADAIRKEHGYNSYIVLMSGSPAPKSPADWWSLCEIACPGFLREGSIDKLKNTIAVIKKVDNGIGGSYPKLVAYRDSTDRCKICGQLKDHLDHDPVGLGLPDNHEYQQGVNEVHRLYRRMTGLVDVKFKSDCLADLPDKIYKIIRCKPTQKTLNLAKLVQAKAPSTIQAITLLRELSDGFQYQYSEAGVQICTSCGGGRTETYYVKNGEELDIQQVLANNESIEQFAAERACSYCSGSGIIPGFMKTVKEVTSEKEAVVKSLLEEHEEVGRIVIYAGYTVSIDKLVKLVRDECWEVIRADGRGWFSPSLETDPKAMIMCFQNPTVLHPKIAFIGHPGAAGMGLTLTASPTIVYYSNDFNAESRIQSEDRIHRLGMDANKGATIIDILNLPTDELILNNLKNKRRLQHMSMGELQAALDSEINQNLKLFEVV